MGADLGGNCLANLHYVSAISFTGVGNRDYQAIENLFHLGEGFTRDGETETVVMGIEHEHVYAVVRH